MVTFSCRNCGFKYSPKGSAKLPDICGNCGGKKCLNIAPDANQLLNESNYI